MGNQPYKRQFRDMPDEQKQKIAATLKNKNMQRSPETKKKISDGLKQYWKDIPSKNNNETKLTDLL